MSSKPKHKCPKNGCSMYVYYCHLGCGTHWKELPKSVRDAIFQAVRDHGRGSNAHTRAILAAIQAWNG